MRPATKKDKERIVDILYRAYRQNPSVLWVVKQDNKVDGRIRALCEYCFTITFPTGGIYITSDGMGVCMMYPSERKAKGAWVKWEQLKLIVKSIGWGRVRAILHRESFISSHRQAKDYLYFWMLAVDPEVKDTSTVIEMRDECFRISKEMNRPIFAETSVLKNKRVYERYGFETYYEWKVPNRDITIWMMKRDPK